MFDGLFVTAKRNINVSLVKMVVLAQEQVSILMVGGGLGEEIVLEGDEAQVFRAWLIENSRGITFKRDGVAESASLMVEIEVNGGVVDLVKAPPGVVVKLIDRDAQKVGEQCISIL